MPEFIHLHNHSHYSLLDGASTVDGLVRAAADNGMPAVALTDHGVMFGAVEFHRSARKSGIKPIIGCEVYIVTKGSRFDKEIDARSLHQGRGRGIYHHLVLLAKNLEGYRNLVKLVTLGHVEGFYYKPRIDLDLLASHTGGLVALSACLSGVVSAPLAAGRADEARAVAVRFQELFGSDFYLEIQDHSLAKERPVLEGMPLLARELGIRLIATNDVHYVRPEHAVAHNVMLMIPDASAANTTDYRQLRYQTDQIYFKSASQMCELFKGRPEAIESTIEVAEKIEDYRIEPEKPYMPHFPIPEEAGAASLEEYLDRLARAGLRRMYPSVTAGMEERLGRELEVINSMGYAGYFLITEDFISSARRMGIRVGPGRGSAAGSLVSYALGITTVDPLKYNLLFERFLNPERVSMPDIDVDFADDRRNDVIDYVKKKYGEESVSQIITFGTLLSRAVIKDVGRVLGVPLQVTEAITKQIPVVQGKVTPLAEALNTIPDLAWVRDSADPKIKELIEISLVLEGMNRNASMHAAGVVIAPGPISDYVPLFKTPQTDLMTQYNMIDLEHAGLLKMDFLGLRTLTVIDRALRLIAQNRGVDVDIDRVPEDDGKTFELFGRGQTVGVFQFESPGMQDWLRKLKPTSISDLVAMNALYRPGPMEMIGEFIRRKQGLQKVEYLHPRLEAVLKETYGVIVYQEQVITIASEIAGFSLAKADLMRRAMGKKDKALMARQREEFVAGAVKKGVGKKLAGDIFDMIDKFAAYGFNKSHSVAYSVVAYQTAYLKAHYPDDFMAATLSTEFGNTDTVVKLIDDCRKMGIRVLPPDVNESDVDFIPTDAGIRFGMGAIKNVGVSAVENIMKTRAEGGEFSDIFDFTGRVDLRLVNKKTCEALILAGAFDSLHPDRARIFDAVERAIQHGQGVQGRRSVGQSTLFESQEPGDGGAGAPPLPETNSWTEQDKLSKEKSVLGFYVSGHPLLKYEWEVQAFSTASLGNPAGGSLSGGVRICGIISAVRTKIDKKGNKMAFVTLEDFTGKGECIVFSKVYQQYAELIRPEAMVMVLGSAERSGDSLRVLVNEMHPIETVREKFTKSVVVSIRLDEVTERTVTELKGVAQRFRGSCPCTFHVSAPGAAEPVRLFSNSVVVDPNGEFISEVERLLGPDSVRIMT